MGWTSTQNPLPWEMGGLSNQVTAGPILVPRTPRRGSRSGKPQGSPRDLMRACAVPLTRGVPRDPPPGSDPMAVS